MLQTSLHLGPFSEFLNTGNKILKKKKRKKEKKPQTKYTEIQLLNYSKNKTVIYVLQKSCSRSNYGYAFEVVIYFKTSITTTMHMKTTRFYLVIRTSIKTPL